MTAETFMKGVSAVGTLLSIGTTLRNILDGPDAPPSLEDIVNAVGKEVREIFRAERASTDLQGAAIALDNIRDWLADVYLVQKEAKVSQANKEEHRNYLIGELMYGTGHEGIGQLEGRRENMLAWAADDVKSAVFQATSLYLGISLFLCLLYRELSEQRTDAAETAGDLKTMRTKAWKEYTACKPRFDKIVRARLASVQLKDTLNPLPGMSMRELYDQWTNTEMYVHGPRDWNKLATAARAYHAYLATGSDDDLAVLNSVVDSVEDRTRDDFRNGAVAQAVNFTKWAADARTALQSLLAISGEPAPTTQDGWFWCERCGVMHYRVSRSWCHKDGLPHSIKSENYRLHHTTPPAQSQADWRWCRKCGTLHYERGPNDPSVCPAGNTGARHDSADSANYAVLTGDTTHQIGWRWCRKCGALHTPGGTGVCPAGGTHDATKSGHYSAEPVTEP